MVMAVVTHTVEMVVVAVVEAGEAGAVVEAVEAEAVVESVGAVKVVDRLTAISTLMTSVTRTGLTVMLAMMVAAGGLSGSILSFTSKPPRISALVYLFVTLKVNGVFVVLVAIPRSVVGKLVMVVSEEVGKEDEVAVAAALVAVVAVVAAVAAVVAVVDAIISQIMAATTTLTITMIMATATVPSKSPRRKAILEIPSSFNRHASPCR